MERDRDFQDPPDQPQEDETRRPTWLEGVAPEDQGPGRPDLEGRPDPLDDTDEAEDPPHLARGSADTDREGPAPYDEPGRDIP